MPEVGAIPDRYCYVTIVCVLLGCQRLREFSLTLFESTSSARSSAGRFHLQIGDGRKDREEPRRLGVRAGESDRRNRPAAELAATTNSSEPDTGAMKSRIIVAASAARRLPRLRAAAEAVRPRRDGAR